MELDVRVRDVDLTEAIKDYIERRLRFSLGRFGNQLGKVSVRVSDLNGPRGGVDKSCRISVELLPAGTVLTEDVSEDLFAAIDRAAERIGRSCSRKLERVRELRTGRESIRI